MALSNALLKAALDTGLSTTTHIGFSANGSTETASVPRVAATFAAASTADPSVAILSAGIESTATAGVTVTHRAGFTASSGGTQTTTWVPLQTPVVLLEGGKITFAAADISESLNADDTYV